MNEEKEEDDDDDDDKEEDEDEIAVLPVSIATLTGHFSDAGVYTFR